MACLVLPYGRVACLVLPYGRVALGEHAQASGLKQFFTSRLGTHLVFASPQCRLECGCGGGDLPPCPRMFAGVACNACVIHVT